MSLSSAAHGGDPPTDPYLQGDPGEHTAPIRSLAADRLGRWLATVSVDKTLRIWDLTDGRLKSTFRPPIGQGTAGELWAVAMSHDGGWIAAGGSTQFYDPSRDASPPGYSIYLVDRATGRLLRRITGVPQPVNSLDLSADGRTLAVGYSGDGGLRLLDVNQGRLIAEDLDYAGPVPSVSFAADGRLLTASHDGLLRLYRFDGSHLTLLIKRAAPGGDKPVRARLSPDGKRIAVGFTRSPSVDVLDGETLAPLASLHTSSVTSGYSAIAWSRDGKHYSRARRSTGRRSFAAGAWMAASAWRARGTGRSPATRSLSCWHFRAVGSPSAARHRLGASSMPPGAPCSCMARRWLTFAAISRPFASPPMAHSSRLGMRGPAHHRSSLTSSSVPFSPPPRAPWPRPCSLLMAWWYRIGCTVRPPC